MLCLLHILYYMCHAFYMGCITYDMPFIYAAYLFCTTILGINQGSEILINLHSITEVLVGSGMCLSNPNLVLLLYFILSIGKGYEMHKFYFGNKCI